jgi:putative ABC transport system ATP-binding protein
MEWLLEAGRFTAHDGEGRLLFSDAVVRLPESKTVILEGPSGSGKSTLLRHVAALASGSSTRRRLMGEAYPDGRLPLWRAQVTLMAQDAPMVPGSLRENLEFPYEFQCASGRRFVVERAKAMMAEVGLEVPLTREIATLSGGERHRLALVRGVLWDPPVLLADEPFSGLDPESASACLGLLLRFAHRPGRSVLLALHDVELGSAADARVCLRNGRLETS